MSARAAVFALVLPFVAVATVTVVPREAFAQKAKEDPRKAEGDKLMLALRYADALAKYEEAYKATKNPALLYNMGRAYEALARFPEALEKLEAFDKEAPAEVKAKVPALNQLLADIRARVATITIHASADGIQVTVRDQVIGRTPIGAMRVNAGKATVDATADGFLPFHKDMDFAGGQTTDIPIVLTPKSTTAVIVVSTQPAGAIVSIDGGDEKLTTPFEKRVEAGTHDLEVSKDGFKSMTTSIVVAVGDRKETTLKLEKNPGLLSKWYFWTGVGVVVVGGAVLTAALLTEKSAPRGDIAPGQVSAGLHF